MTFFFIDSLIIRIPKTDERRQLSTWTPPPVPLTISDSYRCWKHEIEDQV